MTLNLHSERNKCKQLMVRSILGQRNRKGVNGSKYENC